MPKAAAQTQEPDIYKRPVPNMEELRAIAMRIVFESGSGENPIELLNTLIRADCKLELFQARYSVDGTTLAASAMQLAQDSARNANHRRTLARNMNKASGTPRPQYVEAHHIVSAHDGRAGLSRRIIFQKNIGINDNDNGNYQPAAATQTVAGLEAASPHRHIHTTLYHLNVTRRLLTARDKTQADVRGVLRAIKAALTAGTFTF
jgi:A nuclease family of the HNH/ENDO VII superfamily with conserved AHH